MNLLSQSYFRYEYNFSELINIFLQTEEMLSKGKWYIDGFVQDCSNSIAKTLEFLQSYTKPSRRNINNPAWVEIIVRKSIIYSMKVSWTHCMMVLIC